VNTDVHARYFGAELNDQSLVLGSGGKPSLGPTHYKDWLKSSSAQKPA